MRTNASSIACSFEIEIGEQGCVKVARTCYEGRLQRAVSL